jgi:oxepin-CoA hydrolase/3-oxo-5,6-dehydrosuberyl-CoA semialdehyde dehydrogenase
MAQFIDITNKRQLIGLLQKLDPTTVPLWGKMKPQQMVEHLVNEIEYTNRENDVTCDLPEEVAAVAKQKWIYTDAQIPKNLVFVTLPEQYKFEDLATAISQLGKELEDFERFFSKPGRSSIHPGYGPLNYLEWLVWHGKHFTHHLRQFGLLPE